MRYLKLEEALAELGIEAGELEVYEREHLITIKRTLENEAVISAEDVERARLVALLLRDLEVNLPGAEVIVHMRDEMIAMRRQFAEILEQLTAELRAALGRNARGGTPR
ncbi:MAG: chaperone modulator CbpM [Candidatus Binatia bacterium]